MLGHSAPPLAIQRARLSQKLGVVNPGSTLPRHVLIALQRKPACELGRLASKSLGFRIPFRGCEHSCLAARLPQEETTGPRGCSPAEFQRHPLSAGAGL